ncbi:hypothetical protein [Actinokineospora globicatena]|uniref:DUF8017 domain-containing protein n=1 Tax=Actinokineospora globicatena TaxID=103729 RepID=A0A9W6QJV8_9PSEU|nr:hypothetical protein [Actinokineospora globicatena]GLW91020.1 hypothetical protein Aglo03_18360 [Actinokineospora globicatena]
MSYPGGDYQGLGFYPGPPRRDRRTLVIAVSVAAIVLVVGAVVAILLLQRQSETPALPTSTTSAPSSTTTTTTTSKATTTTTKQAGRTIDNDTAKLSYVVPEAWTPIEGGLTLKSVPGVTIDHVAGLTEYQCGGKTYSRGVVGGGKVAKGELNQRATELAQAFGKELYNTSSGVEVVPGTPKAITAKGSGGTELKGVRLTAEITSTGDACLASKGQLVLVLLDDGTDLRLLLVNGDTEGGPATPAPAKTADLAAIADSVRPTG